MKLIFMKETVDFIASIDTNLLLELEKLGIPEPVQLLDDKGNVKTSYYLYNLSNQEM